VLGQAEPQSGFRSRKQLRSFDRIGGGAGKKNVAAMEIPLFLAVQHANCSDEIACQYDHNEKIFRVI
jgi:hypothetical protein